MRSEVGHERGREKCVFFFLPVFFFILLKHGVVLLWSGFVCFCFCSCGEKMKDFMRHSFLVVISKVFLCCVVLFSGWSSRI